MACPLAQREAEIRKFCETRYAVDFPLTAKQKVIGGGAHPLYGWIAAHMLSGADADSAAISNPSAGFRCCAR